MVTFAELARFAEQIGARVEAQRVDVRLIGGLAVHRIVERRRRAEEARLGHEVEALPLLDARHLAALPRVTEDVDLVVHRVDLARLEAALEGEGLRRRTSIEPPPVRFQEDGRTVDVIAFDPSPEAGASDLEIALACLDEGFEPVSDEVLHARLARPATLVVLKCVAYRSRWEAKDLCDIARLALLDLQEGATRSALQRIWANLPTAIRRSVRSVFDEFRVAEARGPSAFVAVMRAVEPSMMRDADLEDDVRGEVVRAMQALTDWMDTSG